MAVLWLENKKALQQKAATVTAAEKCQKKKKAEFRESEAWREHGSCGLPDLLPFITLPAPASAGISPSPVADGDGCAWALSSGLQRGRGESWLLQPLLPEPGRWSCAAGLTPAPLSLVTQVPCQGTAWQYSALGITASSGKQPQPNARGSGQACRHRDGFMQSCHTS